MASMKMAAWYKQSSFDLHKEEQHVVHTLNIYMHHFNAKNDDDIIAIDFLKRNTCEELIAMVLEKRKIPSAQGDFELCEIMGTIDGQTCKERKIDINEYPVAIKLLWPKSLPVGNENTNLTEYRFVLRRKGGEYSGGAKDPGGSTIDAFLAKFLMQPKDKEYPDLCMLPELTEQTLLENLKDRFDSGHIYTYIGPILVAVNPFKFYPIYNPKYAKLYQNRRLGSLPPHIFAIADATYHKMLRMRQNQCIVISGESGSGKTESTNFLLHHLTALSQKSSGASGLEQTLLCGGPVLEAFGNAYTAQNNNSSRFGKFIQVNYRENGMVCGANVQIYLLEKSRIISQSVEERNYHVFYYLLNGTREDERNGLFLLRPEDYNYLNKSGFLKPEGLDEAHEYGRLKHSMELVGFSNETQLKIFGVLSSVLLLGNVEYVKRSGYHSDDNAYIQNAELVGIVSSLLQVCEESLLQALTIRRTVLKNETVVTRYKISEALNTRDAMAKCLYNALFHWIVLRINQALLKYDNSTFRRGFYIGILDIFGFEDVGAKWNSFEQFCINYANERLQTYFNQHIFQFEQEEYLNQGIAWTNIEYTDNTECLQLIQGRPTGLFSLVDEECCIAKGTDETLLAKFNQFHKNHEYYEAPQKKEPAFIIAHYAGKVKYQATGFREKNKDLMRQDVVNALKNSKSAFVRELVGTDPVAIFRWAMVRATFRAASAFKDAGSRLKRAESSNTLHAPIAAKIPRRGSESQLNALLRGELKTETVPSFCDTSVFSTIVEHVKKKTPKPKRKGLQGLQALKTLAAGRRPQTARKMFHTVGGQFQSSLSRLMDTLSNANPFFIRCIRSNNDKIPCYFDEDIILRQLRYTGMLETVRIRRAGYSVRLTYQEFVAQFRMLLPKGRESDKEDIVAFIHNHPLVDKHNVQFGYSKVFMRDAEKLLLDDQLHRAIMADILKLQSWFRAVIARKRFLKTREGVIKIQALVRGWLARTRIHKEAIAALCIQTYWRSYHHQKQYAQLKNVMVQFQSVCRGFMLRHQLAEHRAIEPNNNSCFATPAEEPPLFFEEPPKVGSPGQQSDEGILTKESSQDDALQVSNRLKFNGDSDESSGILEGSDDDKLTSVEVTFTLEDTKLKLIGKTVDDASVKDRRGSLACSTVQLPSVPIRRSASSDTLATRSSQLTLTSETLILCPPESSKKSRVSASSSAAKKRSGFVKAKRQLQRAFQSISKGRSDSYKSEDSDDEDLSGALALPPTKHKSMSFMQTSSDFMSADENFPSHLMKATRVHRAEPCSLCLKNITGIIFTQGYKCQNCRLCFHKECVAFACKFPCSPPTTATAPDYYSTTLHKLSRPWVWTASQRHHSAMPSQAPANLGGFLKSWNLTRTQQQSDSADQILGGVEDLRQLSLFMFKKWTVSQRHHSAMLSQAPVNRCSFLKSWNLTRTQQQSDSADQILGGVEDLRQLSLFMFKKITTSPPFTNYLVHGCGRPANVIIPPMPSQSPANLGGFLKSWNLTRTQQQSDSADQILGGVEDLRHLSLFMFKKQTELAQKSVKKRDTVMDAIFKKAIREFHTELISYEATLKEDQVGIKYRDLISCFEGSLSKVCVHEHVKFPVTLGLNAFRGFLNEFVQQQAKRKSSTTRSKVRSLRKKRRKSDVTIIHFGHRFKADIVHVPTYCEVCNQFMWHAEKIFICLGCRISCHKRCHLKLTERCDSTGENVNGAGRIFGAELGTLVSEEQAVPPIVEKLLMSVEVKGLYLEGIYRKSASACQVKQIRRTIETAEDLDQLYFDDAPVHAVAAVVKAFFRELTEPVFSFELYENFLNAAETPDSKERLRCLYSMVDFLPKPNKALLDRLMYHLARVAHQEDVNRMSASNLSVIFAPCLLRRSQTVHAQEQLQDVSRQATIVQVLIEEKLRQYRSTVDEIVSLEAATETVTENIRLIDDHVRRTSGDAGKLGADAAGNEIEQARKLFLEQLDFLDKEKDKLIEDLPPMAPMASSEDDAVTSSDELDTPPADDGQKHKAKLQRQRSIWRTEEYALDLAIPPTFSTLVYRNKARAPRPRGQRRPSKAFLRTLNL